VARQEEGEMNSFKCDVCGRFISYHELENGKARHVLIYPDSDYTAETWETYHTACNQVGVGGRGRNDGGGHAKL
jgi:hypothetical protein